MGTWQGSNRRLQDEVDDPEYRRQVRAERRRQKRAEKYVVLQPPTPEEDEEITAETPEWMIRMTQNPKWLRQMGESMEYWGDLKS